MFFHLLSAIKVNLVDKMKRSTYLGIILHVKHKTFPILGVFTWFLILGKIQDSGLRWWPCLVTSQTSSSASTHKLYLILSRRSKVFHWKYCLFKILQHIQNSSKGFHQPALVPWWGYDSVAGTSEEFKIFERCCLRTKFRQVKKVLYH